MEIDWWRNIPGAARLGDEREADEAMMQSCPPNARTATMLGLESPRFRVRATVTPSAGAHTHTLARADPASTANAKTATMLKKGATRGISSAESVAPVAPRVIPHTAQNFAK